MGIDHENSWKSKDKKGYADGSNRGVIKPMKIVIKRYSGSDIGKKLIDIGKKLITLNIE